MIRPWAQWLILPVFFLCSCCPVNRLKERSRPVETVSYEAIVLEKPTVRFTGHRSLKIHQTVPTGTSGHIEAEFESMLADFGGGDFSALLLERAAGQLGGRLGWTQPENGGGADAVMQIRVENLCFCAPDASSEVEAKLALKVVISDNDGGDVLWRDCLDWSFAGLYSSLQDLTQADAAQQKELFADLAARLLDRLAKHLAAQVPKG
jgi:hypothetical protein